MENTFLKLCANSIKANRDKYGRDFAVFSKKKNKKTRRILKAKRSNTFGNWPVFESNEAKTRNKNKSNAKRKNLSVSKLEQATKENLLNARKVRRKFGIYIFPEGETTPLPIFKFEHLSSKLSINETVFANLKKWKIRRPLPVQMQVIPIMIKGHELLCCAPTGCGKTIAFIIPILTILQKTIDINNCNTFCNDSDSAPAPLQGAGAISQSVKCLVVAPSTVLAHQIYREFVKYSQGLEVGICLLDEQNATNNTQQIHIVISTPKPLAKLIRNNEIPLTQIEIVVLDEADELFDGDKAIHLNDIELIISKCNHPHIQRAFFSATLDDKVMNLTQKFLNDPYKISIGHGVCGAANVEQELTFCGDERGKFIQLLKIIENGIKPPILLFVSDNKRVIELKRELKNYQPHLLIDALHESLSIVEKNDIVKKFRNGDIWFLICNDALSRGMDFLNVETVINYDFPKSSQQYIHRIGRTGRADRCGKAITFWCDVDSILISMVVDVMRKSKQTHKLPQWMIDAGDDNVVNREINEKEKVIAKVGETQRGPIRRGGSYVHGTSVLKRGNKKTKQQKGRANYFKKKRMSNRRKYKHRKQASK